MEVSFATGINDAGQVVGDSYNTAAGAQHAFTGPNGVGMTDLNSLVSPPGGVVLGYATGINNHRQVAISSPIPEPEIYAMLLAGLVCWALSHGVERLLKTASYPEPQGRMSFVVFSFLARLMVST